MSIKKIAWALEQKIDDPIAKLVLIGVCNCYNDGYGFAFPSVPNLASVADCSDRTITRKLKILEDMGLLKREIRPNKTSKYHLPPFDAVGGDSLSGGDTAMSPVPDTVESDDPLLTLSINKKGGKILISEWTPTDECIQHCKAKGLNPDTIWEAICLWNEQNGNKAAYVSPSAFYKNWCNRAADKQVSYTNRQAGYSREASTDLSQKRIFTLEEWNEQTSFWQSWYRQHRPNAIPEGAN